MTRRPALATSSRRAFTGEPRAWAQWRRRAASHRQDRDRPSPSPADRRAPSSRGSDGPHGDPEGRRRTAIPFKTVWFIWSGPGSAIQSVVTGLDGKAKVGITPHRRGGTYTVTACFEKPTPAGTCPSTIPADDTYSGSKASTTIEVWPFTGFFSPVDNPPTENSAKAGSNVPVKFSLGGNRGLNILATGYPKAVAITCSTSAPIDELEEYTTLTNELTYDAAAGRYQYNWKTPKSFAGTCQRLDFKFIDGTTYSALFVFEYGRSAAPRRRAGRPGRRVFDFGSRALVGRPSGSRRRGGARMQQWTPDWSRN